MVLADWSILEGNAMMREIMITSTLMRDLIERVTPSLARILVRDQSGWHANGSGFAISADGLVATCLHVVSGAGRFAVQFAGQDQQLDAQIVKGQSAPDVTVLSVSQETRPLALGEFSQIEIGREVVWCGFPLDAWVYAFHKGMVSFKGQLPLPYAGTVDALQLDGTINRGNSGGPILDPEDGRVVGIVSSGMGGINEALTKLLPAGRRGARVVIAGVDPVESLALVVQQMERQLQLGIGYGISVDYLSQLRRDL